MLQNAAHSSEQQERWLQEYFHAKSAGAEFILPWAVDTFFSAINTVKKRFSRGELKAIVEACRDLELDPEQARHTVLLLNIADACENRQSHLRHSFVRASIEGKIRQLDDTQLTVLMMWAASFWIGRNVSAAHLNEYIKTT